MTPSPAHHGQAIAFLGGIPTPPGAVVIATPSEIEAAIQSIATRILDYVNAAPESPVVLVCLLRGGKFFTDRLATELQQLTKASFERVDLKVSTRHLNGEPLSEPEIRGPIDQLRDRRLLVTDDILDSGVTLDLIRRALDPVAQEVRSAVLVQKDSPTGVPPTRAIADYVGLPFVDARWYSGAGMDMPTDEHGHARDEPLIIGYPPLCS